MPYPTDVKTRWRPLLPGVQLWLLAALVCAPAAGQQPPRLPARQPSYPTPAEYNSRNAEPTSAIGKFGEKLATIPRMLKSDSNNESGGWRATASKQSGSAQRTPSTPEPTPGRRIYESHNPDARSTQSGWRRGEAADTHPVAVAERPPGPSAPVSSRPVASSDERSAATRPMVGARQITTGSGPAGLKACRPLNNGQRRNPPQIVFAESSRQPTGGRTARTSAPLSADIQLVSGESDVPPLPFDPDGDVESEPRRPPRTIDVPLNDATLNGRINISSKGGRISLVVREAPLEAVLDLIAQQQGLNIVTARAEPVNVSATLSNVSLDDALNSILSVAGYTWIRQKDIIVVSPIVGEGAVAPNVQGRVVRVFPLNFVSATDLSQIVTGLLSPAGHVFVTEADPTNRRRTREILVVEDLPEYMQRVEEYVAQVDQPPRQVLIEAHVLRVDLSDETRHGVNLENITTLFNSELTLRTVGFANNAASPAFFLGIDGSDVDAFVEAIQNTTDAKTLASPKVLVVNGQEARIQIGERFGYLVTTTTETSTLQNVNFLDVGVVMSVTPQITDDNQVLMTVQPEVSSGRINVATGLPEEETTEVSSTVMLPDGHGIVIGGLIQETDSDAQTKVPIVGDLWLVGKLFQRTSIVRQRSEIIIALVPRIVPYGFDYDLQAEQEYIRAATPLFDGPLWKTDRPWEPVMPDAIRNPRRVRVRRIPHIVPNLLEPTPNPPEYYFATQPEYESWVPPVYSLDRDHDTVKRRPARMPAFNPGEAFDD